MKLVATTICLLVCAALCAGQTCRNLNHPIVLHLGVCLNLDALEYGATSEMFDDIRESGVTITNIAVEELELPVRGCRGAADSQEALTLTLNVETFVLTGDISRKRLFKTRRGTFRATARNSVVTCTIPIEGPNYCVRPENAECTTEYGSYDVDFTGRLLGIIAKRRISDGIRSRIPREINRLVILALNELLDRIG